MNPREAVERGLIAYVPQDPHLFFISEHVRDELKYVINDLSLIKKKLSNEFIPNGSRIDQLSDGQLYRLLLLIAMLSKARILLFDEPTAHLDSEGLINFVKKLRSLVKKEGVSAIIVDHRVNILKDFVDNIIYTRRYTQKTFRYKRNSKSVTKDIILETNNLSVGFNKPLIEDINITIRSGETILICGRNGSGKTTLAKTLAGILKPIKGKIIINGNSFLIPQSPIYWFAYETVIGELKYYSKIYKFSDVDNLINVVGLKEVLYRNPYTLSVGEARLLALSLAYIAKPKLLILDEPLLGLDDHTLQYVVEFLTKVKFSAIVIMSHNDKLRSIADKCYLIKDRKLIEC